MIYLGPEQCEFCGRMIEDTNETGTLCLKCYMKHYYPEEENSDRNDSL